MKGNIGQLMKQAQAMQENMQKMQDQLTTVVRCMAVARVCEPCKATLDAQPDRPLALSSRPLRRTMPALLVKGWAPPRPSIWHRCRSRAASSTCACCSAKPKSWAPWSSSRSAMAARA